MNGRISIGLIVAASIGLGACQGAPPTEALPSTIVETTTATTSTTAASPLGVLFIGDSFSARIPEPFAALVHATDEAPDVQTGLVWYPQGVLELLYNCCDSIETIHDGEWTVVVLQEDLSMAGAGPPEFYEFTRAFHREVESIGARTVLYMPWEYDDSNSVRIADIASDYATIAAELGVDVAPVGLAWDRSLSERPGFDLYAGDHHHANLRGDYLTAAVLYATIIGQSPEGVSLLVDDMLADGLEFSATEVMTDDDIAYLQRIAWETVTDYRAGL